MEVEGTLSTKAVPAQLTPQEASQAQGPDSGQVQCESRRSTLLGWKRTPGPAQHTPHSWDQTHVQPETYLWTPSTKATSSGEDDMYTQDFPESGDFLGPSTSSSSFTWMVWHRQRARKNSSSRSYRNAGQKPTHLWHIGLKEEEAKQKTINNKAGHATLKG